MCLQADRKCGVCGLRGRTHHGEAAEQIEADDGQLVVRAVLCAGHEVCTRTYRASQGSALGQYQVSGSGSYVLEPSGAERPEEE